MSAEHITTNFHNHAPIQQQVGVQNIQGDYYHTSQTVNVSTRVLDKIPYVDDASFDAFGVSVNSCHPETRVDLLKRIQQWTRDVAGKSIFWLQGKAGTGKSTVSQTMAELLNSERRLGASFFFKSGEGDRGTSRLFFPTIARQLVETIPELGSIVHQAVEDNPRIFEKKLSEQFDKLLYRPLRALNSSSAHVPLSKIIIVDALDECSSDDDIRVILKLWSLCMEDLNSRIKVFITTRPELPIRIGFKRMSSTMYHTVDLSDIPDAVIRHDLSVFLRDNLLDFVSEYNAEPIDALLDPQWPGEEKIQRLVEISHPLFIIAATICRSLQDFTVNPAHQLSIVTEHPRFGEFKQVGRIYLPVLERALGALNEKVQPEIVYLEFQEIIGTVAVLAQPLSVSALASLLQRPKEIIHLRLRPLHSVLHIPRDSHLAVRPIHLSFPEFLLARESQRYPFGVNRISAHTLVFKNSLQLLSGLRQNLCGLASPGERRECIDAGVIERNLPLELRYSCRHWIYHLKESEITLLDDGEVHVFLQSHFLHWLEALSLMGLMSESIDLISDLQCLTMDQGAEQLKRMLEDVRRFVHSNRHTIRVAPLQVYSSAIIFAPKSSIIRSMVQEPSWVESQISTDQTWSSTLEVMEGHSDRINAIAFASSELLASASDDKTIRLWNSATGLEVQRLEGHTHAVTMVAFSRNGDFLASASGDGVVLVWDLSIGQISETINLTQLSTDLDDHEILALSFKEDNRLFALVRNVDIFVWDISSEKLELIYSPSGFIWRAFFSDDWKSVICIGQISNEEAESDEWWALNSSITIDLSSHTVTRVTDHSMCTSNEFYPLTGLSGEILAFWGSSQMLHFHHVYTDACLCRYDVGDASGSDSMALSRDLRSIAYATSSNALKIVALGHDAEESTLSPEEYLASKRVQFVNSDPERVVVPTKFVTVYSLVGGHLQQRSLFHDASFLPTGSAMELSNDRNLVAVADSCGFSICDLRNNWRQSFVASCGSHDNIASFSFSYDDQLIVVRWTSGALHSRQVAFSSIVRTSALRELKEYCSLEAIDFGDDDFWMNADSVGIVTTTAHKSLSLAVVFGVNSLAIWDIVAGGWTLVSNGDTRLFREGRRVKSLAFSPDDSLIVSSDTREITVWHMHADTKAQKLSATFPVPLPVGKYEQHMVLAISHNNKVLVIANAEKLAICKLECVEQSWELQNLHVLSFGPSSIGPQIHNLQFSLTDDTILTNLGNISISQHGTISFPGLFVREKWIQKDGQDILYIPHDYRSEYTFVAGSTIMMVTKTSGVDFVRITL